MRATLQKTALAIGLVLLALPTLKAHAACPALVILERSTNTNRVWYEKSEKNPATPITAKWEMREKGPNQWEPLTPLEEKRAYGIKIRTRPDEAEVQFAIAGVQKVTFTLKTDERTGCAYVSYLPSAGAEMNIRRIKLTMKKSLIPSTSKVQFIGTSLNDGRTVEIEVRL